MSNSFFVGIPTDFHSSGNSGIPEPDQKVTDLEDQLLQGAKSNDLALKDLRFGHELDEVLDKDDWRTDRPRRPGYGTTGEPIKLWTNHFHMNLTKAVFYRYAIKVEEASSEKDTVTSTAEGESSTAAIARGSTESSSLNKGSKAKAGKKDAASGKQLGRIIELLLAHNDYARFEDYAVSDFSATLLSITQLHRNPTITILRYQMEGESHISDRAIIYKITVEGIDSFDLSYLEKYLKSLSTYGAFENRKWLVQALNIFLRHHARTSKDTTTLGRKAFPIDGGGDELDLPHCLSAMRGFYSSVWLATSRGPVNVNINHSTFYKVGQQA